MLLCLPTVQEQQDSFIRPESAEVLRNFLSSAPEQAAVPVCARCYAADRDHRKAARLQLLRRRSSAAVIALLNDTGVELGAAGDRQLQVRVGRPRLGR